jgi:hypothetical protein
LMQYSEPYYFPIHSKLIEAKLIVDMYKIKLGLIKEKLGSFEYPFVNS